MNSERPLALVTGVSRREGIGAAIAVALAEDGWDLALASLKEYDARMHWGEDAGGMEWISGQLDANGARVMHVDIDLGDEGAAASLFDRVEGSIGVSALVLAHCESVASTIESTSLESFDRHFAVNTRATWLLLREFGLRFRAAPGTGRIVSLTSDHVAGNLPYGASKAAMDAVVLAAAAEFSGRGITANVINPGPTDTGWMSQEQRREFSKRSPLGRTGLPRDAANLVRFLCSEGGGWINGQLLHSSGGFR